MSYEKQGHWQSIYNSFSPSFYRHIWGQSLGRTLGYILLLSFVVSLLLSVKYTFELNKFAGKAKVWILAHMDEVWPPGLAEIKIENGQVSSPAAQPFIHKYADVAFILDTTGKINSLDEYKQGVLITRNKVLYKAKKSDYASEIREYDLARVESFNIQRGRSEKNEIAEITTKGNKFMVDANTLSSWIKLLRGIAFAAMLGWFFLYYVSAKIFQASIFLLLALLINKITAANLKKAALFNIASYALTPATIFTLAVMLSGIKVPLLWFAYSLLYGVYLAQGIKNVKESVSNEAQTYGANGMNEHKSDG